MDAPLVERHSEQILGGSFQCVPFQGDLCLLTDPDRRVSLRECFELLLTLYEPSEDRYRPRPLLRLGIGAEILKWATYPRGYRVPCAGRRHHLRSNDVASG